MAVQLNHTIVRSRNREASAEFFTELLACLALPASARSSWSRWITA